MIAHPPDALLTRRDATIHRCDCGSWIYGARPCGTCTVLLAGVTAAGHDGQVAA